VIAVSAYADHVEARGCDFFRLVSTRDLEGIGAKWKAAPYCPNVAPSSWIKIKNPEYSKARERAQLFER
jgi:ATP-dependent DNA ligase